MSSLILPAETDYALALREPNLLVPGRKPVGAVKVKQDGLARGLQFAALVQPGSQLFELTRRHAITLDGGATVDVSVGGGSFFMDRTAAANFVNTSYAGVTGNSARTIAFFMRSSHTGGGVDENCILSYGREQLDNVAGTVFRVNNESGTLAARFNNGAATWSPGDVNSGNHCIIISMPSAARISDVVLDYDGRSLGAGSIQTTLINTGTDFPFRIGRFPASSPGAGTWFGGWVWNVFVWNRQLSSSERAAFYFQGLRSLVEPANDTPFALTLPTGTPSTVTLSNLTFGARTATSITPRLDVTVS